jgi:hypothetical protein
MLLRAPGDVPDGNASVLVRPRTPAASVPTPTPSATDGAGGVAPGETAAGRDPFGGTPGAAVPSTRPPADDVASGRPAPTSPATTAPAATALTTAPTTAPTSAPTTAPTTAPAPVTVTTTVTRTAAPTVTPTVTMTAPASAVYVGFYLWNGEKASFRVNTRTYSKAVGSTFGPQLTFTSIVKGPPRCAKLRYQGKSLTLCPGQVVRLP